MNKLQLIEYLKDCPDDYEMVLSQFSILDESDGTASIWDIPIMGIVWRDETKEISFIANSSTEQALDQLELKAIRL